MQKKIIGAQKHSKEGDALLSHDFLYYLPLNRDSVVLDARNGITLPQEGPFDVIFADDIKKLQSMRTLLKEDGTLYVGAKDSYRKVIKAIQIAGFTNKPNIYLTYPSQTLPRFIIPLQDRNALEFSLQTMTAGTGIKGALTHFLLKIPGFLYFVRYFFRSHIIFVKK